MKRLILISLLVVISILFIVGCSKKEAPLPVPQPVIQPPQLTEPESDPVMKKNLVEMTTTGFVPKTLTIKVGDTVTFVNKDSTRHWPASNIHPTHQTYPGSNIEKCGTSEQSTIFDACKGLMQGEEYSFTFDNFGRWPYHDHLKPSLAGTIVVES